MSRRRAPRPAAGAFRAALDRVAPKTPLAAVAAPVSERAGTVTIECVDTVWAQELDLMQEALLKRLQAEVGEQAPKALRFRVNSERF